MKKIDLLGTFLTHIAYASGWAMAFGCLAEILAPGSVLAHVRFFWLLIPFFIGSVWGVVYEKRSMSMALLQAFPLIGCLLVFLWTKINQEGMSAELLGGSALLLAVSAVSTLFISPTEE